MSTRDILLEHLADGRFHSGQALAQAAGVSRAAIWKQLRRLEELGLEVVARPGRGYRLGQPLELLDSGRILGALDAGVRARVERMEVFSRVASTNGYLLGLPAGDPRRPARLCLAEYQSAGRGRRSRRWISPFGANIYLSVGWRFREMPPGLPALALCLGVACAEALGALGARGLQLKWPNDLWWHERKLGGLLLEIRGEAGGSCDVVAGIGLNVCMPGRPAGGIGQPWVDLREVLGQQRPHRSELAAALVNRMVPVLEGYAETGFAPFRARWEALDALAGREVELYQGDAVITGVAEGVDAQGAIRIRTGQRHARYVSGEVSLRLRG